MGLIPLSLTPDLPQGHSIHLSAVTPDLPRGSEGRLRPIVSEAGPMPFAFGESGMHSHMPGCLASHWVISGKAEITSSAAESSPYWSSGPLWKMREGLLVCSPVSEQPCSARHSLPMGPHKPLCRKGFANPQLHWVF